MEKWNQLRMQTISFSWGKCYKSNKDWCSTPFKNHRKHSSTADLNFTGESNTFST